MRSDHRERQVKDTPVWKENVERMIVGLSTTYYVREEQGWSGDSRVCIFRRFAGNRSHNKKANKQFLNHKEVFVEDPYVFPCFKREIETS